jgi:Na+-transporting methylmalonyl-CoA/oxaloacetate decarboxylase gamma subunit
MMEHLLNGIGYTLLGVGLVYMPLSLLVLAGVWLS